MNDNDTGTMDAGPRWRRLRAVIRDENGDVETVVDSMARGPFALWDYAGNGYERRALVRVVVTHLGTGLALCGGRSGAQAFEIVDGLMDRRDDFIASRDQIRRAPGLKDFVRDVIHRHGFRSWREILDAGDPARGDAA